MKERLTAIGHFLLACYRHPLGWSAPWLMGVVLLFGRYYLVSDILFLLTAWLGWRPLFRALGGWIHGRHRTRTQAQRIRPDARASTGGTNTRARTEGAPARLDDFNGFELTVGSIYGIRSWTMRDGLLRPINYGDYPWGPGENVARCIFGSGFFSHKVPGEVCRCGFYAYTNPQVATYTVKGVIEGYGRTLIGSKGFRCEKARIVAFLDPRGMMLLGGNDTYQALREHYPDVPIYHTQRAMLRAFPLGDE